MVDLRSDTVTKPSAGMRQAMADAEVGDDVYGEDPTVNRLQEAVAERLGKAAALFVPSGVMANQIALKVHTAPGDEVVLNRLSHIYNYESGAPGLLSGVQLAPIDSDETLLTADQVAAAVRPTMDVFPRTRLVSVENTLNKGGGAVYPLVRVQALAEVARAHGLALHLDGARLWHASAAADVAERDYAAPFDTVAVALSKGLGAPVGSVLAGSADRIAEARRYRKLFGGGMRQAGVLAAAGLYALEHHRPHLAADHAKAKRLAEGLAALPGFAVDPAAVETNIVLFDVEDGEAAPVIERLREAGVRFTPFGPATLRATTHRDVSMDDIDHTLDVMRRIYGAASSA